MIKITWATFFKWQHVSSQLSSTEPTFPRESKCLRWFLSSEIFGNPMFIPSAPGKPGDFFPLQNASPCYRTRLVIFNFTAKQKGKQAGDPLRYLPVRVLQQQGWSGVAVGGVCPFSHWDRSEIQGSQLFSLIIKVLVS